MKFIKRNWICILVAMVFSLLSVYANAQVSSATHSPTSTYLTDRIIVKYKKNVLTPMAASIVQLSQNGGEVPIQFIHGTGSINALHVKYHVQSMHKVFRKIGSRPVPRNAAEAQKAAVLDDFASQDVYVLEMAPGNDVSKAVKDFQNDPNVAYAQPDYKVSVNMVPNDPYFSSHGSWGQSYDDLWNVKIVNAPQAWDITQGQGVIVAVVDTGVDYTHPDIAANIVPGWNFVDNNNDPMDHFGHGTHVAGTIAAVANDNIGIVGIAPKAQIMPLKALDDTGNGTIDVLSQAIVYAARNGAKVISNSWGCSTACPSNPVAEDAVRTAENAGSVVVFAAGNSSTDVLNFSPQNMTDHKPIVVAASDPSNSLAYFSNYGKLVDVTAPGSGLSSDIRGILSLKSSICDPSLCPSNLIVGMNYLRQAGTSMACPHVSGEAALVLSVHPNFTPDEVREAIDLSANPLPGLPGAGLIDTFKVLSIANIPYAQITSPSPGMLSQANGVVLVNGTANSSANFDHYTLSYSSKDTPTQWVTINSGAQAVANGLLGSWSTATLKPNIYYLYLQVWAQGTIVPASQMIQVSIPAQNILNLYSIPAASSIFVPSISVEGNIVAWVTNGRDANGNPYANTFVYNLATGTTIKLNTTIPANVYVNQGYVIVAQADIHGTIGIFDSLGNLKYSLQTILENDWSGTFGPNGFIQAVNNGKIIISHVLGSLNSKGQYILNDVDLSYFDFINDKNVVLNNVNPMWSQGAVLDPHDVLYFLFSNSKNFTTENLDIFGLDSNTKSTSPIAFTGADILRSQINALTDSPFIIEHYPGTMRTLDPVNNTITDVPYIINAPSSIHRPLLVSVSPSKTAWVSINQQYDEIKMNDLTYGPDDPIGASGLIKTAIALDSGHLIWADAQGVFSYPIPPEPLPVFQPLSTINATVGTSVNFQVEASDPQGKKLTLTVQSAGGSDLSTYMPGALFNDNGDGTGNFTWAIPNNQGTGIYSLNFTAINSRGMKSSMLVVINVALSPPVGLMATAENNQISLAWFASKGATSYSVERSTVSGGPYTTIASSVTSVNSWGNPTYLDTPATNGTTYYYVVTAVNAGGQSPSSLEVSATPEPPPSAPAGLKATRQVGQVTLSWTANPIATSYNIKRATTSRGPYSTIVSVTTNTAVDSSVSSATTYYYVVSAVDGAGEGPNSAQIGVTIAPQAPSNLIATAGNSQVALSWTASTGATSYEIKRAVSGGTWAWITTGLTTTTYTDTTVTNGTAYNYLVAAVYAGAVSPNSAIVHAKPMPPKPSTPANLSASAGDGQVALSWSASSNATSYTVERAPSGGTYSVLATGVTQTSFTDTTVSDGTRYFYFVKAINIAGSSPNSTVVNAMSVPPAPPAPTGLTAGVGSGQVVLAWNTVTAASSYIVKRAPVGGTWVTLATGVTSMTYTDTTVTNGSSYYYLVVADDQGALSPNSKTVLAKPVA